MFVQSLSTYNIIAKDAVTECGPDIVTNYFVTLDLIPRCEHLFLESSLGGCPGSD